MLLDSSHSRWIKATLIIGLAALGFYLVVFFCSPERLTGGTTLGLWYGIIGSLLMVFAGLLSAHRRLARFSWLPRRSWMLRGHIWMGLLSFVFILCHSGFGWGGTLERILWIILALILISGLVGWGLQATLPRLLASQFGEETPYEQMPHVCKQIVQSADRIMEMLCGAATHQELITAYDGVIRPFLLGNGAADFGATLTQLRSRPALTALQSQLKELEDLCQHRQEIARQEKIYHWLHSWLFLHIPLAVLLLVLGVAHAIMSLYY